MKISQSNLIFEEEPSSKFIGVSWNKSHSKWQVSRWSKIQGKTIYNGRYNRNEETKAAHASDTLAKELIADGEENHKLNFLNDETEVWAEKVNYKVSKISITFCIIFLRKEPHPNISE